MRATRSALSDRPSYGANSSKTSRSTQRQPFASGPRQPEPSRGDAMIGIIFAILAGSNLVQGSWSQDLPWLNLTAASFVLAVPLTLASLRHRIALRSMVALLILTMALTLGYIQPAMHQAASEKRVSLIITVLLVTVATLVCLTNERRLAWFFGTVVALGVLVGFGQVLAPDPTFLATGRRTPVGLNSIGAGRALGAGLIVSFTSALQYRPPVRNAVIVLVCLPLGSGIVLSGSRGPLLGVAVALGFVLLRHPGLKPSRKPFLAILGGAAAYAGYRLLASFGSRITDTTDSGRGVLYSHAVRIALEHPWGIGWGNFSRYAGNTLSNAGQSNDLYAHNVILEFWIEAGAIGGVLFVIFALIVLIKALRIARTSPSGLTLSALAVSLFVGALLSSNIIGDRMMWVSSAAILGTHLHASAGQGPVATRRSVR